MEKCSLYFDCKQETLRFKWIESEREGRDLGADAIQRWEQRHWHGYVRARCLEHLQGTRFWIELDHGDFGLLLHRFLDKPTLINRILDRLKIGHENLNIINWAIDSTAPMDEVLEILEALDINNKRLPFRFET